MASESHTYTPSQIGQKLNLKAGMVRRYAQALESVLGERLEIGVKGERLFSADHLSVLERTRDLVRERRGLGVEIAIEMVLGHRSMPNGIESSNKDAAVLSVLARLDSKVQALENSVNVQTETLKRLEAHLNKLSRRKP